MKQLKFLTLIKDQRRYAKCREETEQDRKARAQAQVEAAVAKVEEVGGKGEKVILVQAREDIAFAATVVRERPIHWGPPVMNRNAPSAERP
jgi:putative aminopeptidase FrvX